MVFNRFVIILPPFVVEHISYPILIPTQNHHDTRSILMFLDDTEREHWPEIY